MNQKKLSATDKIIRFQAQEHATIAINYRLLAEKWVIAGNDAIAESMRALAEKQEKLIPSFLQAEYKTQLFHAFYAAKFNI